MMPRRILARAQHLEADVQRCLVSSQISSLGVRENISDVVDAVFFGREQIEIITWHGLCPIVVKASAVISPHQRGQHATSASSNLPVRRGGLTASFKSIARPLCSQPDTYKKHDAMFLCTLKH